VTDRVVESEQGTPTSDLHMQPPQGPAVPKPASGAAIECPARHRTRIKPFKETNGQWPEVLNADDLLLYEQAVVKLDPPCDLAQIRS
jgi:hypothetical protein